MDGGEMDGRNESEETREKKTGSCSKELDETSSINSLQPEMDEDESALNGLKSNCATASRKRKLGSSHEDGSKNEEDAEVQEIYENDLKKEMVEDVRNFKLVVKKSKVLKENEEFSLPRNSEIVIGRQSNLCDMAIPDLMISKRHCKIVADPQLGPCVYDLGSKHGTIAAVRKPGDKGEGDAVKRFPIPIPQAGLMLKLHDELTIGNGTVVVLELANNSSGQAPCQTNI